MKEKIKRREVYIGDTQWLAIKKVAKDKDVTISSILREAIKKVYKV